MICLTCDLHHASLRTGNQSHCEVSEIEVVHRCLSTFAEAKVKVTFFISGKCFEEEWPDLKPIAEHPLVEIGGHGYNCFKPELWHRASKKLFGSYNGPAWYQAWDARKTVDIVREKTGHTIRAWRNHMYMHGPHTERVLAAAGIHICSDGVAKDSNGPKLHPSGIYNFPLNMMPDHEHLYHAERTPEFVARWVKRYNWRDDFGSQSYYIEDWTDIVLDQLRTHEENGIISNMIVHPITMYLCDGMKSFARILAFIAQHETVHMRDIVASAIARRSECPAS